jgi:uncharacterized phage infection (PIP) family protein YhgE
MLKLLPSLDFTTLDEERKEAYNKRTVFNRQAEQLKSRLNLIGLSEAEIATASRESTPINDVLKRIDQLQTQFNAASKIKNEKIDAVNKARSLNEKANEERQRIIKQIENLQTVLSSIIVPAIPVLDTSVEDTTLGNTQDEVTKLKEMLKEAESTNRRAEMLRKYDELHAEFEVIQKSSENATARINEIDTHKTTAMESAIYPIEGLGIDDTEVLFNGRPFSNLADSEKLKVSMAMAIAMNPSLRVVFIRDGSLLSSASRKEVMDFAKEHDFQLWMEITTDQPNLVIEEVRQSEPTTSQK